MVVSTLPDGMYCNMYATAGHIPEIELKDGSTADSSAILETPEDDQCWLKHVA
jgi:hypothetical protein